MTDKLAKKIADLINLRNQLTRVYSANDILLHQQNYVFLLEEDDLVACAESKKVQWYQWEICHVSVSPKFERKGKGTEVLNMAEKKAIQGNARILQSTIRSDNERSISLFTRNNYQKVNNFVNANSGNIVNVYQKSISKTK